MADIEYDINGISFQELRKLPCQNVLVITRAEYSEEYKNMRNRLITSLNQTRPFLNNEYGKRPPHQYVRWGDTYRYDPHRDSFAMACHLHSDIPKTVFEKMLSMEIKFSYNTVIILDDIQHYPTLAEHYRGKILSIDSNYKRYVYREGETS